MASEHPGGLSPDEVEVFARGLYHLASLDGLHEREEGLLREFLRESGASLSFDELRTSSFSPSEAALALQTSFLRRIFVRAAVAMIKADGEFSGPERRALGEIADAFGMSNAEFGELEQQASGRPLE